MDSFSNFEHWSPFPVLAMLLIVVPLNTLAHIPNWAQTYGCKYAFLLSSLSIWVGWMGCDTTSISSKKKIKTTATKKLSKYLFTLLLIPPTFYNWLTLIHISKQKTLKTQRFSITHLAANLLWSDWGLLIVLISHLLWIFVCFILDILMSWLVPRSPWVYYVVYCVYII